MVERWERVSDLRCRFRGERERKAMTGRRGKSSGERSEQMSAMNAILDPVSTLLLQPPIKSGARLRMWAGERDGRERESER